VLSPGYRLLSLSLSLSLCRALKISTTLHGHVLSLARARSLSLSLVRHRAAPALMSPGCPHNPHARIARASIIIYF
jgi:hypothetical protein